MDGKNVFIGVLLIVLAVVGYQYYIAGATAPTPTIDGGQPEPPKVTVCPTVPTVNLGANDKYTSGQVNWGTWKYKADGTTSSDTDGSFSASINTKIQVLVADANSSTYYRSVWTPTVDRCDVNQLTYNNVLKVPVESVICFNELGQPINGTTYGGVYNNLSIGTGGSRTARCELTSSAKKGFPGGVMFLEMNSSAYKEAEVAVTWDGAVLPDAGSYGAYTLGTSLGAVRTFRVPAFEGAGVHTFYVTIPAEASADPDGTYESPTSYGDGIQGYIIPENCYEEEDVTPSEFRCGIQDMDSTFVAPGGTTKYTASIATFAIPVQ